MAWVDVEIGDGADEGVTHRLRPGDFVGRHRGAALRVDDPRVSEAHAMISLRDGELVVLALRGGLAVQRQRVGKAVLVPGLQVRLAKGVYLTVLECHLPAEALGLIVDEQEPQLLLGSAASLIGEPEPGLSLRFDPDALAQLWSDGVGWRIQARGHEAVELVPGVPVALEGHRVEAVMVPLQRAGQDATVLGGRVHPPLRIVAHYDTAHIHREGVEPVLLSGNGARILGELVALDGPAPWEVVAGQIWRDEPEPHRLRRRWDVNLGRLRAKLEQHGVRPDLVRSDGTGNVEFVLLQGDVVEDRT